MEHLTNIRDISQAIERSRLCLFYIKSPYCSVCKAMLDKVGKIAAKYPSLCSFYTDITEEPLLVGHFLVNSGPTVLLLMNGKEVYRGANFINLEELERTINQYLSLEETIQRRRRINRRRLCVKFNFY